MYKKYIKRALDFILSLLALIILSPLLLVLAIAVKVKLGSPVIFKQQRPGKNEKIFTIYKFRTMKNLSENQIIEKNLTLDEQERITKFGNVLRMTSLDELPELFNILKGDMSIIGPRPLRIEYLPYYTEEEMHRHDVRPGLTGLAQVNGRNTATWEERFKYDIKYINNIKITTDIFILFNTIKKVFKKEDILVGNQQIMKDLNDERKEITYADRVSR